MIGRINNPTHVSSKDFFLQFQQIDKIDIKESIKKKSNAVCFLLVRLRYYRESRNLVHWCACSPVQASQANCSYQGHGEETASCCHCSGKNTKTSARQAVRVHKLDELLEDVWLKLLSSLWRGLPILERNITDTLWNAKKPEIQYKLPHLCQLRSLWNVLHLPQLY